jgi:pimeloyl-ACP methyl ester carboxylesterase
MNRTRLLIILTVFLFSFSFSFAQKTSKPVYVIVHGAWGGGWAFKKVDSLLRAKGCIVYRPTLTGQGERAHLASPSVGLSTHINDVVNLILYEDLHDIILIGHSYGGMVVTGVADSLPGRIKKLIYLDAFVPENGESVFTIPDNNIGWAKRMEKDGFFVPEWLQPGKQPPADVPHSVKTFTDSIVLKNPLREKIPTTYILTVAKGMQASADDFAPQAERARKKGWPVLQLEADHNPQRSTPEALVNILLKAGK